MQLHSAPLKLISVLLLTLFACDCLPQQRPTSHEPASEHQHTQQHHHAANPSQPTGPKCGYKSCPKIDPKRTNVHIIAHSHDDVGWLKTVDQYFYGSNKKYSQAGVQYILDSVVPQLVMDPSKRFIFVEMSFFYKWWEEQDAAMRKVVRQLVNEGRLEFINGGWCMNDEANVNYHSTIEQMTLGLKFLNETFGHCGRPKVGWQIDPFGHSNEQASLFAQFGFDGMFFTRISYTDKAQRVDDKSLDLIWHGDAILQGQSGSIFTNIFRDGYDAPDGYCYDALCLDDPFIDNRKSYEFNADIRGEALIGFIEIYAQTKLTNHVLIPFGGDFQFTAAHQNFKSLDKLMKFIRQHAPHINVFYSTPSCYQYAVHEAINQRDKKINLPEKYNDFMPYDSHPTVWWSGYFSSRPSVKLIERELADLLQVARLASLTSLLGQQQALAASSQPGQSASNSRWLETVKLHESRCLRQIWEVLGDLQHHDAITGTEKQHVSNDYVRRASDASKLCSKFIGEFNRKRLGEYLVQSQVNEQLKKAGRKYHLETVYLEDTMLCPLLNISQCDALESTVNVSRFHNYELDKSQHNAESMKPIYKFTPLPKELETKGVLMTAYNPLARQLNQIDFRLPCNGKCDLDKVHVIQVATNETMKLVRLPVPAGIFSLPFRDAVTSHEVLFYANLAPLSSTNFVITDENVDEIVNEESEQDGSILITDETSRHLNQVRSRRMRRAPTSQTSDSSRDKSEGRFAYFSLSAGQDARRDRATRHNQDATIRFRRQSGSETPAQQAAPDRVIVKFDMATGVIHGLRRASDKSFVNLTQRFGFYGAADTGHHAGAYIFRPNTSEPRLYDKPISFRMYKRQSGALIEIHQKWADWIWQTIRVDSKKNYIEFDYVIGPIPFGDNKFGREVITRYQTNIANDGIFLTDSNARQLLPRTRLKSDVAAQLGGSFYPVVSTLMIKNNHPNRSSRSADAVSILVDRPQAGTSLNEGDLELLIHRRLTRDDNFGVGEALDEPGEDGKGLVTRGRHRFYFKFHDQTRSGPSDGESAAQTAKWNPPRVFQLPRKPRENITFESHQARQKCAEHCASPASDLHIVNDKLFNDIRQESVKYALKPVLTFDRLRVTAREYMQMLSSGQTDQSGAPPKTDTSLLNTTLPDNIHLLTLQTWDVRPNQLLIRLENLDNPLTIHPTFDLRAHRILLDAYRTASGSSEIQVEPTDACFLESYLKTEVDIEYMINNIRFVSLEELNLGANNRLADDKRLDWTQQPSATGCDFAEKQTTITLRPRQIRTFLATFEQI